MKVPTACPAWIGMRTRIEAHARTQILTPHAESVSGPDAASMVSEYSLYSYMYPHPLSVVRPSKLSRPPRKENVLFEANRKKTRESTKKKENSTAKPIKCDSQKKAEHKKGRCEKSYVARETERRRVTLSLYNPVVNNQSSRIVVYKLYLFLLRKTRLVIGYFPEKPE